MDLALLPGPNQRASTHARTRMRSVGGLVVVGLVALAVVACAGSDGSGDGAIGSLESVAPTSASALPIDPPSPAVLQASPKKVFAHYMTNFPLSIDNAPADVDYYASQYLLASGEDGKFASSGGFIRERPLTRSVLPESTYLLEDMKSEVRRAIAAGIDGFTVDLLSLTGTHWSSVKRMITAAQAVDPKFSVVLMPDTTTDTVADPAVLASKIASVASSPAVYHLADGRLVVSPFFAENKSVSWWTRWIALMKSTYGIDVAFVPTFLDPASSAAFAPISYGFSIWGDRSPASIVETASYARDAHARGKIWMQPIAVQDARPSSGIFAESNNTETLRTLWQTAIDSGAEWVQLVTWNDYAEGTEFAPSSHIGWGPLDISQYYIGWFKTAVRPAIVRDALFVSHRVQPWAARPTGPQTELMELVPGSSPARDTVEVLSFLTGAQRIDVRIGGATFTFQAPAGVSAMTFPLSVGAVSATIQYGNGATLAVTSASTVVDRPAVQDLQYHFASTGRDGTLTGVPPPVIPGSPETTPATAPASAPATSPSTTPPTAPAATDAPSGIVATTAPVTVPATAPPTTAPPATAPATAAGPAAIRGVAVGLPPVLPALRQG